MKKALLWICACVIALSALSICAFAKDVVIYENDFSDPATIADFKGYRLAWEIRDGGLYLTDTQDAECAGEDMASFFAHIIWQAPKALPENYVVEVDAYNVQTSTGIVFNVEQDKVDNSSNNSFYGYLAFLANDAKKGALGATTHDGNWSGNINVGTSDGSCAPGSNVHIKVEVKGDNIKVDITNIDTKATVYTYEYVKGTSAVDVAFDSGTVGFRMRAKNGDNNSVGNAYFDNFKVTTTDTWEGTAKAVELKMTVNSKTAYVNGEAKELDAEPIIRQNRTMLPVRFVAENLGATVDWDGTTSTATLTAKDVKIEITIGATTAKVNGEAVELDSPAFIENSRTYLPVRFVAEKLGATVDWDGNTSTATITK